MNLYLMGYRGSGKTTVATLLASRLGRCVKSTDDGVQFVLGMPISEIFERLGEAAFRRTESDVVRRVSSFANHIIDLGGGAVIAPENRQSIRQSGRCVYLRAMPQTLWHRIGLDPASADRRPNLTAAGGLQEVMELMQKRAPVYESCADYTIDTDDLSADEVAAKIAQWWQSVDN